MKRICPRCNEPLSSNCYVKDKGINTLSYLELIIKKDQFQKENKEIKSCYCSKCGYVELYIDIDDSNKHHNNDDPTQNRYFKEIDLKEKIKESKKNKRKKALRKRIILKKMLRK